MKLRVTMLRTLMAVLLLGFLANYSNEVLAQVDVGDEFIVFVDGKNVLIPFFDGTAEIDLDDPTNTVANFPGSGWAAQGFRFDATTGADLSAMVSPTVAGGTKAMYMRIKIDPAYAGIHPCILEHGDDCIGLTLFDKNNGTTITDDREGRLKWYFPDAIRDGEWHDLKIPLPPDNVTALDSAKVGKKADGSPLAAPLDPNTMQWDYVGGWTGEVPGWGGTAGTPHGISDVNWQPFQWDAVTGMSAHFDFSPSLGGVQIDDFYFGDDNTDISGVGNPPAAMTGATFAANGTQNKIAWAPNPEFGGYRAYVDTEPITTARLAAGELPIYEEVAFNADAFEVNHPYEIPHNSMAPMVLYYALTSINQFGIENTDVSASAAAIANPTLPTQAFIYEIDNASADLILGNLLNDTVADDGFILTNPSFDIGPSRGSPTAGPGLPADENDLSASLRMAFNREFKELYIYGEIRDEVVTRHPGGEGAGGLAWGYDSIEMGWAGYDVRDVEGGSILAGSPHNSFERGTTPDYQLRQSWLGSNDTPDFTAGGSSTFITTGDGVEGEMAGSGTVFANLMDGANVVGYKYLTLLSFADFVLGGTGDAFQTLPAIDGMILMPFNIAINDGDDVAVENPRNKQVSWSTKPTIGDSWWNTPSQWMTIAMVGKDVVNVASEEPSELPEEFVLEQNYPNPFNPTTSIEFSLPVIENVTLSVYNVLGQRVAMLIQNEQMSAGHHSVRFDARNLASGMYVYRLEAGNNFSKTMPMILLK